MSRCRGLRRPPPRKENTFDDDDDEDSKDNFSHIESTDSGDEIIDLGKTPILKASELQVPGCGEIGEDETAAYLVRPRGLDRATFLLAPGASEPLRPMSSIASGGEKARLMLAMKMAPAMDNAERDIRNTESPTISVFDRSPTRRRRSALAPKSAPP